MKLVSLFGLIAMIPAALNASAPRSSAGAITVLLCRGNGVAETVTVPLRGGAPLPGHGDDGGGCCAKGCHAAGSRKRGGACHN